MLGRENLSGKRFGRLIAVEMIPAKKGEKTKWLCKCDCGNEKITLATSLKLSQTKSCGCYRKECVSRKFKKHGKTNERIYSIWLNMKNRCLNENNHSYKRYGERGISICEEWMDFTNFYDWSMSNGYEENLTLDRIDNNGNYDPSNCRWATSETQMNNTSYNVFLEIDGVTKTLSQHAKDNNISYYMLHKRYKGQGIRGLELLNPSKRERIIIELYGMKKNLKDWAKFHNMSYGTVQHRYKKGLRGEDLFQPVNEIASKNANSKKKKGYSKI